MINSKNSYYLIDFWDVLVYYNYIPTSAHKFLHNMFMHKMKQQKNPAIKIVKTFRLHTVNNYF